MAKAIIFLALNIIFCLFKLLDYWSGHSIRFYDSDSNPKYSLDVITLTLQELVGSKVMDTQKRGNDKKIFTNFSLN